jgi:hypothetical protein
MYIDIHRALCNDISCVCMYTSPHTHTYIYIYIYIYQALCNDTFYFETLFVDVNILPNSNAPAPDGARAAGEEQTGRRGAGDKGEGRGDVTKESVGSWETGEWYPLKSDLVAMLGLSVTACGRMGAAKCSLPPGSQVLLVVRLKVL